ncbi:hypothetical protein MLD38_008643 [Melastoma candidum]|uniref:Uncharacterized protein n=1 Tax=Melastoma candidum TaxID=119954 RepID=A0ACB9RY28_9MYRT|nr:hypothetical protein MLD38_008643 [Melastoma candidum]
MESAADADAAAVDCSADMFAEFPPLEFYPFEPLPEFNPSPAPPPDPIPGIDRPAANPSPNPSPNPSRGYNPLLSFTVPRRPRRGRSQRNVALFSRPMGSFGGPDAADGSSVNVAASAVVSSDMGRMKIDNANFSATTGGAVPDASDEIIVINREATAEALTGLSAGFPADSLTDEEIDFGVLPVIGGIEQVNYILIRNHIISKWRANVNNWVVKEMFLDVVPKHCHGLLDSAYDYLVSHGYVNFGVAPAIKEKIPKEPTLSKSVIIIGAGLAGLGAARQLMRFGFRVLVLEGRKRAGGRVYTKRMEGGNPSNKLIAAADLGGSVLTGTLGNPLGILARQLGYPLHKVRDKCPLYNVEGKPVDPNLDVKVETEFNKSLDKASSIRKMMGDVSQNVSLGSAVDTFREVNNEEMSLFNWHLANLEYANAALLSNLSLAFWDQDDPYDMGGDHCFLHGGNGKLVEALTENVPIMYEKIVNTIRYGRDGVQVSVGNQVINGDIALCTVPLGVLKSGSVKFIPELPQRKLDGIKRLGFGLLNKVAMLFPYAFWGKDIDTFGHLTDEPSRRGEFFLFYSYATVAGGPLLIALVAGEAAHNFEILPPTEAVTRVIQILRDIYEPQGVNVPDPVQTVCTRWAGDPFSLGSYSNVAVGASGDDYDILAESVGDGRLFFAGEATTRRYPATMHGAFLTGLREAANIFNHVNGRASRIKIEKSPLKSAYSCALLLADLFREPDLRFGSFSVIYSRDDPNPQSGAILRVTFEDQTRKGHDVLKPDQHSNKPLFQQLRSHFNLRQQPYIYTLLTKEQALELREVRGGDDMRIFHLTEKFGFKLIGRKGLGPNADAVIASIKAERSGRKPASNLLKSKAGALRQKPGGTQQKVVRKAKIMGRSSGPGVPPKAATDGGNMMGDVQNLNQSIPEPSVPAQFATEIRQQVENIGILTDRSQIRGGGIFHGDKVQESLHSILP